MTGVVIVGVGSPFGADRMGWEVLARLQHGERLGQFVSRELTLRVRDRPGAGLLHDIRDAELAILVDAVQAGLPAGTLVRIAGAELASMHGSLSSHGLGVAETLALGDVLGLLPASLVVYGVEMGHDQRTLPAGDVLNRIADTICGDVQAYLAGEDGATRPICPHA